MPRIWSGLLIVIVLGLGVTPIARAETGAELQRLPVLDALFRSENPLSASGKWQPLNWDASTVNRTGRVNNQGGPPGWGPSDAAPAVNGAYWSQAAFKDSNGGEAVLDVITVAPEAGSYSSLWLDMTRPQAQQSGYQLQWERTSGKLTYTVTLKKWNAGESTTLASASEVSLSTGVSLALVDVGSSVQAWINPGTGSFSSLLSASDSTFHEGYAGVSGVGTSRSSEFRAGNFTESRLEGLALRDNLSRSESPLSSEGRWLPLAWDMTGTPSHKTGQATSTGWTPIDASPSVNGAYWAPGRFNDSTGGNAAEVTMGTGFKASGEYSAIWIDMANPGVTQSGYQFSWILNPELSTYTVKLKRWSSGSETLLASASSTSIPVGSELALVDRGTSVEALIKSGSAGFARLLSGNNEAFSSGYAGLEASGTAIRLTNFRAGSLTPLMYWGAWTRIGEHESPYHWEIQEEFEKAAGRKASLVNFSSPWNSSDCLGPCYFNTTAFNEIRNHGEIPFFSWGPNGVSASDAEIAAGAEEAYIRRWAIQAKEWGHPFFLRFAWEMNGFWFRWGLGNSETKNTAADYVAMWKKVHTIFAEVGATNVTWVWCPNVDPDGKYEAVKNLYPGSEYVDWTCLDAYNEGGTRWKSFQELLGTSYTAITAKEVAPAKPMVIGETASTEFEGSKSAWITGLFSVLPTYSLIHGVLWFEKYESGPGGHEDWPIVSSTGATSAFAAGLQNDLPATAEYGGLEVNPIPPTP